MININLDTTTLSIKNETAVLQNSVYDMMYEIKKKLDQGYNITSIRKVYNENNKDYPFYVKINFVKECDIE